MNDTLCQLTQETIDVLKSISAEHTDPFNGQLELTQEAIDSLKSISAEHTDPFNGQLELTQEAIDRLKSIPSYTDHLHLQYGLTQEDIDKIKSISSYTNVDYVSVLNMYVYRRKDENLTHAMAFASFEGGADFYYESNSSYGVFTV